MTLNYCTDFLDYLDPSKYLTADGKKQPPPCSGCAEASATMQRAERLRKDAESMERGAERRVEETHPPKIDEAA